MTFTDIITKYVVPIVGGMFILFFVIVLFYIIHRALIKPLGIYAWFKKQKMKKKKDKLLGNERILTYCMNRIEQKRSEEEVKDELVLSNKYTPLEIEEILFVFGEVKKEIGDSSLSPLPLEGDLP